MDKQSHFEAETVREYDELVRNLSLSLSLSLSLTPSLPGRTRPLHETSCRRVALQKALRRSKV